MSLFFLFLLHQSWGSGLISGSDGRSFTTRYTFTPPTTDSCVVSVAIRHLGKIAYSETDITLLGSGGTNINRGVNPEHYWFRYNEPMGYSDTLSTSYREDILTIVVPPGVRTISLTVRLTQRYRDVDNPLFTYWNPQPLPVWRCFSVMSVETTELRVDTTYDLRTKKIIKVDIIRLTVDTTYSLTLTMNGERVNQITRGDSSYAVVIARGEEAGFRIPCPFSPSEPFSTWGGKTIPAPQAPNQAVFLFATISGTPRFEINLRQGTTRWLEYLNRQTHCFKYGPTDLGPGREPGGDYWIGIKPRESFRLLVTYIPIPR